jgi:hypothetical protein
VPETQISLWILKRRVVALLETFQRTIIEIISRPKANEEREKIAQESSLGLKSAVRT